MNSPITTDFSQSAGTKLNILDTEKRKEIASKIIDENNIGSLIEADEAKKTVLALNAIPRLQELGIQFTYEDPIFGTADNIIFTKTYDDGTEERQITIPIDDKKQIPSAITEINKIISEFSNPKVLRKYMGSTTTNTTQTPAP